jgi:hypothetical protein
MAAGGAVLREKPGESKVVILNELERRVATLSKEEQSPSPDGMSIRLGPEPLC